MTNPKSIRRAQNFAWITLAYTTGVILWGAVVRITGSGAGCGQHWPTCHGEVVPLEPSIETLIEFGHRLTSGLCGLLVLAMVIVVFRATQKGHAARKPAILSGVFILTESAIGAAIVLLEYVADDASSARGIWMAVHLTNTFILSAVLFWTGFRLGPSSERSFRLGKRERAELYTLGMSVLVVSMAGAVSALGHTLFPALDTQTVIEHVTQDPYSDTTYPMIIRVVHPAMAMLLALVLLNYGISAKERFGADLARPGRWLVVAVVVQTAAGIGNIALSAPGWMQVVHLGLANGLWLALIWVGMTVGTRPDAMVSR